MKKFAIAALFCSIVGGFGAASAEENVVRLHAGAPEMTNAQNMMALHREIIASAHVVCAAPGRLDFGMRQLQRRCIRSAADAAIESAAIPSLHALHAGMEKRERYALNAEF